MEEEKKEGLIETIKPEDISVDLEKMKSVIEKNALLNGWAEKIYRTAEAVWKTLVAFLIFPTKEGAEKFRNEMHGKKFGEFIAVIQSKAGLLYLKIGGYEMADDYYPSRRHIEKIKKFLEEQGEKNIDVAQQILMQLADVPITARMIRGKILYPEIEEMEKKIEELWKKLKKTNEQLQISLETWAYLTKEIESPLCRANTLFFSLLNKSKETLMLIKEKNKK